MILYLTKIKEEVEVVNDLDKPKLGKRNDSFFFYFLVTTSISNLGEKISKYSLEEKNLPLNICTKSF